VESNEIALEPADIFFLNDLQQTRGRLVLLVKLEPAAQNRDLPLLKALFFDIVDDLLQMVLHLHHYFMFEEIQGPEIANQVWIIIAIEHDGVKLQLFAPPINDAELQRIRVKLRNLIVLRMAVGLPPETEQSIHDFVALRKLRLLHDFLEEVAVFFVLAENLLVIFKIYSSCLLLIRIRFKVRHSQDLVIGGLLAAF